MKKQIKKLIALLLVICMSNAYIPMTIKADTTDRVLTSEDIPDENLYSAMLNYADWDGDGELKLSEVEALGSLRITEAVSDFTGLELITNKIGITLDPDLTSDNTYTYTQADVKSMLEKLKEYDNVCQLNISYAVHINKEIYDIITHMSLEYLSVYLEKSDDYSFIKPNGDSDKPFYETVYSIELTFAANEDAEFSLENFEGYNNLAKISMGGYINFTDTDKLSQYNELDSVYLRGYYPKGTYIDLSENTNLTRVIIENYGYTAENVKVTIGNRSNVQYVSLDYVSLTDIPITCNELYLSHCDLPTTEPDFSECEYLNYLTVTDCGIEDISGLENCTNLFSLNLTYNELTKVPALPEVEWDNLALCNNYLTKEDVIANAPEKFTSNALWVADTLQTKIKTINGIYYSNIYTELNTEYFNEILNIYPENYGTCYHEFRTNCNEIVIEKEVLEKAAAITGTTIIFDFCYYDELGNMAMVEVDLRDAYEELGSDCIINFGFGEDEEAVSIWNTENVYHNLHEKYKSSEKINGVAYSISWNCNSYNVYTYTDSAELYKYCGDLERMSSENLFEEGIDYYFITAGADPNYSVTSEEGCNSGPETVFGIDVLVGYNYNTISKMEDNSTINVRNGQYGYIDKDSWNLIISKKMTLNIWVSDSGVYLDAVVSLSWDQMSVVSEDVYFNCNCRPYVFDTDDGLLKSIFINFYIDGSEMISAAESADVQLYVGDFAKNGEDVCKVLGFDYISTDNQRKRGYEIFDSYTVDSGKISLTVNINEVVDLRNKNNIGTYNKLELPGDITYYEAGDEMASLTGKGADNIDFRGYSDAFTVSCDFTKSELYGDTFWGIEDRTGGVSEYMYLSCDGGSLYLCIGSDDGYARMCCPFIEGELNNNQEYHIDVVVENIDDKLYATIFLDGTVLGVLDSKTATAGNATQAVATSGNASGAMYFYGNGVDEFDLTSLNTIYCNEFGIFYNWSSGNAFSDISLTVYAGNIFAEESEDTGDSDDTGESEDTGDSDDAGESDNAGESEDSGSSGNSGNDDAGGSSDNADNADDSTGENTDQGDRNETQDSDSRYEEPEHIEDDDVIDSDEAVDELIKDMKDSNDKTTEVVSKNPHTIGKDVFETMKNEDKNIVCNVTNDKNELMYSWSFAPKYIENPDMDVDLEIEINEQHGKVDKKLGDKDALYINFKHHGKLPGPATIKVYVGNKYRKDDIVCLYYYDEDNDRVLKVGNEPLKVKEGGYIEFTISHCSTYFVFDEDEAAQFNEENGIELDKDSFENVNFNIIDKASTDVESGNDITARIAVLLVLVCVSAVTVFTVMLYGKNRKRKIAIR